MICVAMLHQRRHSDVALQLTKYFSSTVEISTSSKMVIIEKAVISL